MALFDSQRLLADSSATTHAVVAVSAHASRLRDPEMVLDAILAAASGADIEVSGVVTESEDDLREAIASAEGGRLVLAGGDGGVHFALNAADAPIEVGLIPMG